MKTTRIVVVVILCILSGLMLVGTTNAAGQPLSAAAKSQIAGILSEKQSRTPEEQKLDSNLLYAMRAVHQRLMAGAQPQPAFVDHFIADNVKPDNTVVVTVRAKVTDALLTALASAGAQDVASFPTFDTVTARLPIAALVLVAGHADVRFIRPLEKPLFNGFVSTGKGGAGSMQSPSVDPNAGNVTSVSSVTSEGVVAHGANLAISTGINGTGTFVCALSNGINSFAARQATGDLPTPLYVLSGQQGSGDEGTAMLEIVHDMAPGAALGFATGFSGEAQMATNILNLRNVLGCNIIVDDVTYSTESAFQDGPIAQAVNSVTASGALYFSSAANSGNFTDGTSGTWEGDWVDSGFTILDSGSAVPMQRFGANWYNVLGASTSQAISLAWSDPNGASKNDYDLFLLDSTGTFILQQSTNVQNGFQDPSEWFACSPASCPAGSRIVVAKYSGQGRALRIDTSRGTLSFYTDQSTFGHNAASTAITVAAVNVATASGGAFVGGPTNPTESFSSDGLRTLFYYPNGAAITPGNFLFSSKGGTTLFKVDLAAADGVTTSTPGYIPFFGTSAAAPHAAAIAALVKSANPSASASTVANALFGSTLDNDGAGWDRDAGYGIVMAPGAVRAVLTPLSLSKNFSPSTIAPGGTATLTLTVTNSNAVALQNVAFTDTYPAQIKNAASPNPNGNGPGCGGILTAVPGGGTFAMTTGVVPAGTTCNIFVTVTSSTVGIFVDNTAVVTTPVGLKSAAPASAALTVGVAPTITSANNSTFTQGTFGMFTVTTAGTGVVTISKTGALPSGVAFIDIGNGTATLSGTSTVAGSYPFTITANNGVAPSATQAFTLIVNGTAPTITSANNATFTQTAFGTFVVTTTGSPVAPISFTGALPTGLTFADNGNGSATLSGSPSIAGSFPLTITANNGVAPNATQAFMLNVTVAGPGVPSSVTVSGGYGQSTLVGTVFAQPLVALVKDVDGNPVSNVTVTWSAPAPTASATFSGPTNTLTDASGLAMIGVTANSILGTYAVTAQVGALSASFTLTNAITIATLPVSCSGNSQTNADLVEDYYQAILRRPSEPGARMSWMSESDRLCALGADPKQVYFVIANAFFNAPEYIGFHRTDSEFVTDLYRTFFGRLPDAGGFTFWTGQLAAGMPRNNVMSSFLFTPEFTATMNGVFPGRTARAESYLILNLYGGLFRRLADSGGYTYWTGQLQLAQCSSNPPAAVQATIDSVSSQFVASAEYAARASTNSQFVQDMYYAVLQRGAEPGAIDYWVGQLNANPLSRNGVRQQFLTSPEMQAQSAAIAAQGCLH